MKILKNQNFYWKYETAIAYLLLAFQYLMIVLFPSSFSQQAEKSFVYLWFFDYFLFFPIVFISMSSLKTRRRVLLSILVIGFVVFWIKFNFNTIFFNTFISIFLANRILFFPIDDHQKKQFMKRKRLNFIVTMAFIFVVTLTESLLENLNIIHHQEVGSDGYLMSLGGKISLFSGYYLYLAYLEYRKIKKEEKLV